MRATDLLSSADRRQVAGILGVGGALVLLSSASSGSSGTQPPPQFGAGTGSPAGTPPDAPEPGVAALGESKRRPGARQIDAASAAGKRASASVKSRKSKAQGGTTPA